MQVKDMRLGGANDEKKANGKEIESVERRFGDEQSTLLDQFERLSVEVQLKRAMLGRSLSEPSTASSSYFLQSHPPPPLQSLFKERRSSGLNKLFKRLFRPFFRSKKGD
ncbi:uncharacterized protein LOC110811595 isoform X1 [Carica papaya]|uniref:uncharacterized protein LOC110811595 isoform X1 n=1 Tax=Carica papaya TaxID=3649 RepID=UPI000B8CE2B7|nr:uncharacterized protein LOC110811595 isoform X1 [Carica papaya]